MMNNENQAYDPIKGFCKRTGLSQFYIRQRIKAGTLPFIRSGNTYYVNVAAALEVLDRESRGGSSREVSD